jgi:hypothetical protein
MKKVFFFLFGLALTSVAVAQTTEKKEEMKHLKKNVREKREENHEVNKDVTHLNFKAAKADHKDKVAEKRAAHTHADRLKNEGVKHPMAKAKHQIHAQDEAKKNKL